MWILLHALLWQLYFASNTSENTSNVKSFDHDKFQRWRQSLLQKDAIRCCGENIASTTDPSKTSPNFRRLCYINVINGSVTVETLNPNATFKSTEAAPSRMTAMKVGIQAAITYAMKKMNVSIFPDFYALFSPFDDAKLVRPSSSQCKCGNSVWPPIFAQNREFVADNLFITVPDFSYFTDFKYQGVRTRPFKITQLF